jgi:hypothetical protein
MVSRNNILLDALYMVFPLSHNTSQRSKHNPIYDGQKNQKRDDLYNKSFIYTDKRYVTDNLHGSYSINQRPPAELGV